MKGPAVRRALATGTVVAMTYGVGSLIVTVLGGSTSRWWVLLLSRGAAAAVFGVFVFFWSYFAIFRPASLQPPGPLRRPPSPGLGPPDTVASVVAVALGVAGVIAGLLAEELTILLLGLMVQALGLGALLLMWYRRRRDSDRVEQANEMHRSAGDDL